MLRQIKHFIRGERGATAIEYSILARRNRGGDNCHRLQHWPQTQHDAFVGLIAIEVDRACDTWCF